MGQYSHATLGMMDMLLRLRLFELGMIRVNLEEKEIHFYPVRYSCNMKMHYDLSTSNIFEVEFYTIT